MYYSTTIQRPSTKKLPCLLSLAAIVVVINPRLCTSLFYYYHYLSVGLGWVGDRIDTHKEEEEEAPQSHIQSTQVPNLQISI